MRFLFLAAALLTLALVGCAGAPQEDTASLVADGRSIAEAECARCHAVGEYGDSPLSIAPPFRFVLTRYSENVLKEELIEGIRVNHEMPDFQFNPQSTDALIAYLRSIQQ